MKHTFAVVATAFVQFADRAIVSEIKKVSGPPIRTGDTVFLHEIDTEENYNYSGRELELPVANADNANKGLKMGFVLVTYGEPILHEAQQQIPFEPEQKSQAAAAEDEPVFNGLEIGGTMEEITDLKDQPDWLKNAGKDEAQVGADLTASTTKKRR